MSTYANVRVNGEEFHVNSDGGAKEDISSQIKAECQYWTGKVKTQVLVRVVLMALTIDALTTDSWFGIGFVVRPDHTWDVRIGPRGGVTIKEVKL